MCVCYLVIIKNVKLQHMFLVIDCNKYVYTEKNSNLTSGASHSGMGLFSVPEGG